MAEKDPFTLVYDSLWDMAARNKTLMGMIKQNNRIDYHNWIGGKDSISTADLPELALLVQGGDFNFQSTSTSSEFTKIYSWALTTGDFTICKYHCILWELYRALVDWDKILCALQWNGEQIVRNANTANLEEGTLRADQNRRIRGWASVLALEVEFIVPTELMRIPTT